MNAKNYIIAILFLLTPLISCAAGSDCSFPENIVKQLPPQNSADIAMYYWESGRDKRSKEYLKTLHLVYKNGDHAVIQHKYCSMYNFEVVYQRSNQANDLDAATIARISTAIYTEYAAKKAVLARPLGEIIAMSFKQEDFNPGKSFSVEFPGGDISYPNEPISLTLEYRYLDMFNSIYSSMFTLYMAIGGEH
jgi:hypothetical protein